MRETAMAVRERTRAASIIIIIIITKMARLSTRRFSCRPRLTRNGDHESSDVMVRNEGKQLASVGRAWR